MILVKEEMPLQFFSCVGVVLTLVSLALGLPVVEEFLKTGLVPRLPTAVLSVSIMILGFLSFASGLILDTVSLGRRELKRLRYLQFAPVDGEVHGYERTPAVMGEAAIPVTSVA